MPSPPASAAGFRVTYFYSATGRKKFGWSENFFHPGPDQSTVLAAATALQPLVYDLHAFGTSLDYLRITDLSNFRLQKLIQIGLVVNGPATGQANAITDAFLMNYLGSDGRRVKGWIRCIPDSWAGKNGQVTGGFGEVTAFFAALNSNGFCLRGLPRPQPTKPVRAWAQDTGIVTVPGHGYDVGFRGRIKGVKSGFPTTFNRIFSFDYDTANTLKIVSWTPIIPPQPIDLTSASLAPQYVVNTLIQPAPAGSIPGSENAGVTKHDTGRPFNLSTGRARGHRRPAPGTLVPR